MILKWQKIASNHLKNDFFQKNSLVLKQHWLPLLNNAMHTGIVDNIKTLISIGVSLPLQYVAY